jgi:hypothetical protein
VGIKAGAISVYRAAHRLRRSRLGQALALLPDAKDVAQSFSVGMGTGMLDAASAWGNPLAEAGLLRFTPRDEFQVNNRTCEFPPRQT